MAHWRSLKVRRTRRGKGRLLSARQHMLNRISPPGRDPSPSANLPPRSLRLLEQVCSQSTPSTRPGHRTQGAMGQAAEYRLWSDRIKRGTKRGGKLKGST